VTIRSKAVLVWGSVFLSACGGGGDSTSPCTSNITGLCASLGATVTPSSPTSPTTTALYTTAPNSVTVARGASATYTIGGGSGSYTATSSNTSVLKAEVSGTTLTIQGISAGTATVAITDSAGQKMSISANVPAPVSDAAPLYTTAPTAVTLPSSGMVSYQIGGGKAPYTVSSGNPSVVSASVNGQILTISALWQQSASSTPTQITIVDTTGARVTTAVTVLGRSQTGTPPSIYPASITVSDCTSNIPFVFTGGTAPFTVYTGDGARVPVSAPLPFGPDSYFTADIQVLVGGAFREPPTSANPYKVILTVLDSQSRAATADVLVGSQFACPQTARLDVQAGSTVAKVGEKATFHISGGQPPYTVKSRNQLDVPDTTPIARADASASLGSDGQYAFDVTALSTGGASLTGAALITVTSADGQMKNLVLTVYPQP